MNEMQDNVTLYLKRRLLPMAICFGLVCAFVPPLMFGMTTNEQLKTRADVYANNLAKHIEHDALRHPYIWPYRIDKVTAKEPVPVDGFDMVALEIVDCQQKVLLEKKSNNHDWFITQHEAHSMKKDKNLATIRLKVSSFDIWKRAGGLLIFSSLLGIFLGSVVFVLPMNVIRKQSGRLAQSSASLLETQKQLKQVNASLSDQVEHAVQEVKILSANQLHVQDQERARIAMGLHDGLGQMISALVLKIDNLPTTHTKARGQASALGMDIVNELRAIIQDLRPVALQNHGLAQVLKDASEQFELDHQVAMYFKHVGHERCSAQKAEALFRIFQEAMNNIQKHTNATEVSVQLSIEDTAISLTIRDDGQGFDVLEQQTQPEGHGLSNMSARAALLNGALHYHSNEQGTTIEVTLPGDGVSHQA